MQYSEFAHKKNIPLRLMILVWISCIILSWSSVSHGIEEIIGQDRNSNDSGINIKLTPTEKAWLEKNQRVRVAVKNGWMPVEFLLENNKHQGVSIDYLGKIGNLLHIDFVIVNYTENINSEQADVISGVSNDSLRNSKFHQLNQPFLISPYAIYANKNIRHKAKISSLEDLNELRVAVFKNGHIGKKLREDYPKIRLVYVDIADEAFDDLKSGAIDAYVGNELVVDYHIAVHRLTHVEKLALTPLTSTVSMAVRNDWPELASILEKSVATVGVNNKEILNRWQIDDSKYDLIYIALTGGIFTVFLLAAYKLYRLKQVVKRQHAETQQQIWYQANFDFLTKLPNRHLLQYRLKQALERADRSHLPVGLLFIDLDNFKKVNDQSGHTVGDKLLVEAASRISKHVRSDDTTARFGGDEFIVIMSDLKDISGLEHTCQKILHELEKPFHIDDDVFYISASIGVTIYPDDGHSSEELLGYADKAMYEAKKLGRNRFQFFRESIHTDSLHSLSITNDLREALVKKQFVLHYQPIVDLKHSGFMKAEALVRWNHPVRGIVDPINFISLAEESGLIAELGKWVFEQAINDLLVIRKTLGADFQLSINVSPNQFSAPDNVLSWIDIIRELGIPGRCVCLEITEGLLLKPTDAVENTLSALRDEGIEFSIDDFGTGYSALAYLKKFNIEYVKLDRSFIQNLDIDEYDAILCESIIDMSQKLGIKVIAEGVETVTQKDLLKRFACDYGQGILFAGPVPLSQLLKFTDLPGTK